MGSLCFRQFIALPTLTEWLPEHPSSGQATSLCLRLQHQKCPFCISPATTVGSASCIHLPMEISALEEPTQAQPKGRTEPTAPGAPRTQATIPANHSTLLPASPLPFTEARRGFL